MALRTLVSKSKKRFIDIEQGFDLDLSYITDNIIAVSCQQIYQADRTSETCFSQMNAQPEVLVLPFADGVSFDWARSLLQVCLTPSIVAYLSDSPPSCVSRSNLKPSAQQTNLTSASAGTQQQRFEDFSRCGMLETIRSSTCAVRGTIAKLKESSRGVSASHSRITMLLTWK